MPSEATFIARLFWIACLLICLLSHSQAPRYRLLPWYLGMLLLISPVYWPEISGWWDSFWVVMIGLAVLRGLVTLEVFQRQMPVWYSTGEIFGGPAALAGAVVVFPSLFRGHSTRDLGINFLIYWNLFIGVWVLAVQLLLWRIRRRIGSTAFAVGSLSLFRAIVALIVLSGPMSWGKWSGWDLGATVFDSGVFLWMAWIFTSQDAESSRQIPDVASQAHQSTASGS